MLISSTSEQDVVDQANKLRRAGWEMVSWFAFPDRPVGGHSLREQLRTDLGKRWRRSARYFGACRAAGIGIPVGDGGTRPLIRRKSLPDRVPRISRPVSAERVPCLRDRVFAFYAHSVSWADWFWYGDSGRALTEAPSNLPEASERTAAPTRGRSSWR